MTDWFDATLLGRLDDKENGVIVVVMQRLQAEDLAGHLLAKENCVHLNLPAIAEKDEDIPIGHGEVYHRKAGEALHPGLASLETLEKIKAEIGTFKFSAQYQQQPVPAEGEVIKWCWFRTYDQQPTRLEHDRIVQSWDTAMTAAAGSDYSVCSTWLMRKNHFFLLDVMRARLDFPSLKSRVITQAKHWKANSLLIENKGSGQSLIQVLRITPGAPQPISIPVHKDKLSRLAAVSDMIEAGQVFLPKSASWLDEFRSELLQFPNGRYDDQVDSMSQFLNWKRARSHDYVSGSSEGSKLIELDPMTGAPDPDIVDLDDDVSNDGYGFNEGY